MKTFNTFLNHLYAKGIFYLLVLGLIFPVACRQAEEQPEETATDTTTEQTETSTDNMDEDKNGAETMEMESDSDSASEPVDENADKKDDTSMKAAEKAANDKEVVATVNGKPIYQKDLRAKKLKDVIENEIFYIEGLNRGLDKKFADQINDYKQRLISSAVRKQKLNQLTESKVSEEDMRKYYEENESKYMHLIVEQISVKDEGTAKEIRKKAQKGEEFREIADDYTGSDVNVRVKEFRLPTHFNDIFDEFKIGALSDTEKGVQGYELFKIKEIQRIPFEKAKPALRHNVLSMRKAQKMSEFAEEIKKENNIEVKILKDQKK